MDDVVINTVTAHSAGVQGCAGIVVLYQPQRVVIDHIRSYIDYLDVLYVFDNSPVGCDSAFIAELQSLDKVEYLYEGHNVGIAKALNLGLKKASVSGYQWLMTMDQDSYFNLDQCVKFFDSVGSLLVGDVGIVSPAHSKKGGDGSACVYRDVDIVWTSGNLVNVAIAHKVGLFNEDFFIDSVDHEFCLRLRLQGYRILQAMNCFLHHQVGEERLVGLMKRKRRQFHSPKRLYFMIRNGLYLSTLYRASFPAFIDASNGQIRTELVRALKYSSERLRYIYYALKAFRDYQNGVVGNPVGL